MIKLLETKKPSYLLLLILLHYYFPTDLFTIIFHFLLLTPRNSPEVDD